MICRAAFVQLQGNMIVLYRCIIEQYLLALLFLILQISVIRYLVTDFSDFMQIYMMIILLYISSGTK